MRVSSAVQHHPARGSLLGAILEGLGQVDVEVVTDPDPDARRPSAWRTYREALRTTPTWATHRIVIQDDATPCRDFPTVVRNAITAQPDSLISLCVCGDPFYSAEAIRDASMQGLQWAILPPAQWIPAIATVWPVRIIQPALQWIEEQNWPEAFTADDEIIGRVIRELGETTLATVPSLVQHDDKQDSLVGLKAAHGLNHGRVAACFVPDGCDPLTIDWTLGP